MLSGVASDGIAKGLAVHGLPALGLGTFGQQLHGADTVAANGFEQVEGTDVLELEAMTQAHPYRDVVRQQIVEVVPDRVAPDFERAVDRN
jgi:hypothetical protein